MTHQPSISALKPHFLFPLAGDRARKHFLLGSILTLAGSLIIPTLFVAGYVIRVMRRTIRGEPPSMDEWADWGEMLKDGFRALVVWMAYLAPGTVAFVAGFVLYFIAIMFVGPAAGTAEAEAAAFTVLLLAMAVFFLSMSVGTVLWIGLSIPLPAALAHVAAEASLGAGFRFGEVWRTWRANALGFLIVWVLMYGLYGVAILASSLMYTTVVLLCLLPVVLAPFSFYAALVGASLVGEVYAESRARLALEAGGG